MTIISHSRYPHASAFSGDNRARTCDPMRVMHVLSQLSYASVTYCIIRRKNCKHFFYILKIEMKSGNLPFRRFPPILLSMGLSAYFRLSANRLILLAFTNFSILPSFTSTSVGACMIPNSSESSGFSSASIT